LAAFIKTVQVPVPLQPLPLHPPNTDVAFGAAVNVTDVPSKYDTTQSVGQFIPVDVEVTVPPPDPVVDAVRSYSAAKIAVVEVAADIVRLQAVLVPAISHAPVHPVNTNPAAGFAVNVTDVPAV